MSISLCQQLGQEWKKTFYQLGPRSVKLSSPRDQVKGSLYQYTDRTNYQLAD